MDAALSEFGQAYLSELQTLTTAETSSLYPLRDLALENVGEAKSVVNALRQHLLRCQPEHKKPLLYLVDAIMKGKLPSQPIYCTMMSSVLFEMFVHTWDRVESVRPSLRKLCRFWTEVKELDQGVVAQCQMYTLPYGGGMPPVPAPTASPGAARFAVNMPGPGYGVQQRGVSQMVTVPAPSASYIAIPSQPMIAQQPSSYMRSGHYATGMAAQQLPATSLPQVLYPPGSVQTQPILYPGKGMQQAAYMQPLHNMHAGQAQMPMGGTARDLQAHASAPRKRSTVFPPSHVLKDLDPSAVSELQAASATTRSKFLDASFLRVKRLREKEGQLAQPWYVIDAQWIVGASASEDVQTMNPEEEEAGNQAEDEDELYYVVEDPSQPECAISGERFERFFDPEEDKWCFKDAVVLYGEDADKYGVMEGSIVKVHCLDAPPKNANKLINAPLPHTAPPAAQPQQQQPVVAAPSSAPSTVAATGQVHVQRTKRTSDGSSPGAADGSDSAARDAKRLRQLDSNVGMLLGNGVSAP